MPSGTQFHATLSNGKAAVVPAEVALAGAMPFVSVQINGRPATIPEHLAFVGLTQKTQELAGPPSDIPVGYQRIVWNTLTNRPSCWMNRGGNIGIIDAFDPGSF